MKILLDYESRYEKNKKNLEEWINVVKKDKRLTPFSDTNLARSEALSIIVINYAI